MNELNDEMREFCRKVGICWHEWDWYEDHYFCEKCGELLIDHPIPTNPDLLNPLVVLGIMRKRKDFELFMAKLMYGFEQPGVEAIDWCNDIDMDYLINPDGTPERSGKMLRAALEWLRRAA
jgi:hypothetical protein